jgi:hypothetical protein
MLRVNVSVVSIPAPVEPSVRICWQLVEVLPVAVVTGVPRAFRSSQPSLSNRLYAWKVNSSCL